MALIGHHKIHFTQVDSTNLEAKRKLDAGEMKEGDVVLADYQTHGRGQYGRQWNSASAQNVIMSIALSPIFLKIENQFLLNICVSLAIANVVESITGRASVKWPNDIYVEQSKISGILIQNFIQGTTINNSIVGIGLNANQKEWPEGVINATSLSLLTEKTYDVPLLVNQICHEMNKQYGRLKVYQKSMTEEYEERLFRKNEVGKFTQDGRLFQGVIKGIDNVGKLIVEREGKRHSYMHGEIQYVLNEAI